MTSTNRYLPPNTLNNLLNELVKPEFHTIIGKSANQLTIYRLRLGNGPVKVLMWSQMHGNESTTTRAIIGLLEEFKTGKALKILDQLSLFIIPQLNPDSSNTYNRYNTNNVDLNRDAVKLTQPESIALRGVFDQFKPHFCFNLHDQRTIYAAGKREAPVLLSFLSRPPPGEGSITPARLTAMQVIIAIKNIGNRL